ncbi:MAG TPA: PLP-dependent aminotransferase family protein [Planctomycetota bacterium]|nr:PLP-dependent aminotransferase family protein [Planctomycetota bacterium]
MKRHEKAPASAAPAGLSARAGRAGKSPISVMMARALADADLISLAAGFVDYETLPVDAMREVADAVFADASTARVALQYGHTPGLPALRELLVERIATMDGRTVGTGGYSADRVIVGTGSQQLLYLLTEVLTDPGDVVLLGHPSYFEFMDALRAAGVECRAVPLDEEGMRTDLLEELLAQLRRTGELDRVKLLYTVSYFQNPTGISLSASRRRKLYDGVRRARPGIVIVEDAAYRELRYDGDDVPSLRSLDETGDDVVYLETFSKRFAPGLKTGYGLFPKRLGEQVANLKGAHDFGSSNLTQHLCCEIMRRGLDARHAAGLRESYRGRRDAMLATIDETMPGGVRRTDPHGGLYVWLTLPEGIATGPESSLFRRALDRGVIYVPGEFCFAPCAGREIPTNCMRLSFGVGSLEKIAEGVRRLAEAVRRGG